MDENKLVIETNGNCLLCLKQPQNESSSSNPGPFSLRKISRILKLNLEDVFRELRSGLSLPDDSEGAELMMTVCEECRLEAESASELALQLEVIQMKMQYRWKNLYERMMAGERREGIMEELRRRKEKSPQMKMMYGMVERLRSETMQKCSSKIRQRSSAVILKEFKLSDDPITEDDLAAAFNAKNEEDEDEPNYRPEDYVKVKMDVDQSTMESDTEATSVSSPFRLDRQECEDDLRPRELKQSRTLLDCSKCSAQFRSRLCLKLHESRKACQNWDKDRRQSGTLKTSVGSNQKKPERTTTEPYDEGNKMTSNSPPDQCVSPSQRKFKCGICYRKFTSLKRLETHKRKLHRTLECSFCSAIFTTKHGLKFHQDKKVCQKIKIKDKEDTGEIASPTKPASEATSASKEKKLQEMRRNTEAALKWKEQNSTNRPDSDWKPLVPPSVKRTELPYSKHKCKICDRKFTTPARLRQHIRTLHSRKLECNWCSLKFTSKQRLQHHMDKKVCRKGKEELEVLKCGLCYAKFTSKLWLKLHQQREVCHGAQEKGKYFVVEDADLSDEADATSSTTTEEEEDSESESSTSTDDDNKGEGDGGKSPKYSVKLEGGNEDVSETDDDTGQLQNDPFSSELGLKLKQEESVSNPPEGENRVEKVKVEECPSPSPEESSVKLEYYAPDEEEEANGSNDKSKVEVKVEKVWEEIDSEEDEEDPNILWVVNYT